MDVKWRKCTAGICAVIMAVTSLTMGTFTPVRANQEQSVLVSEAALVESGMCGENLTWEWYDDGNLVIQGEGAMEDYADFADTPWYDIANNVNAILIQGGTSIGTNAFYGCTAAGSLTIGETVETIGAEAFANCGCISEVILPENVSFIGERAFGAIGSYVGGCNIEIWNPNCEIYDAERTFYEESTIYGYDGSTAEQYVNTYGGTFQSLGAIPEDSTTTSTTTTTAEITTTTSEDTTTTETQTTSPAETTTEKATTTTEKPYMVDSGTCGKTEYDFVAWEFYSDGSLQIRGMVSGSEMADYSGLGERPWEAYCDQIKKVEISNIVNIGAFAFSNFWQNLSYVNIPYSVETIGEYAFSPCFALTNVTLPDSVTFIDANAFSNLDEITIPNPDCEIVSGAGTLAAVIKGYKGSTAETYALENGLEFVALDSETTTTTEATTTTTHETTTTIKTTTTTSASTSVTTTTVSEYILCGDIDNDGVVTLDDALLLLRIISKKVNTSDYNYDLPHADANSDGEINVLDAASIKAASEGLISLPVSAEQGELIGGAAPANMQFGQPMSQTVEPGDTIALEYLMYSPDSTVDAMCGYVDFGTFVSVQDVQIAAKYSSYYIDDSGILYFNALDIAAQGGVLLTVVIEISDNYSYGGENRIINLENSVAGDIYGRTCDASWNLDGYIDIMIPTTTMTTSTTTTTTTKTTTTTTTTKTTTTTDKSTTTSWELTGPDGILTTTTEVTTTTVTTPADITYGDVNEDGEIDFTDSGIIQRYVLGYDEDEELNLEYADVNADGIVDIFDVVALNFYLFDSENNPLPFTGTDETWNPSTIYISQMETEYCVSAPSVLTY